MKPLVLLTILSLLLSGCAPSNAPTDDELIAHVLERHYDDGGYTVVNPETTLSHLLERDLFVSQAQRREYMRTQLAIAGVAAGPLIDTLYDKNAQPVRLSLPSAPERGYVVDHDGKFMRYFAAKDGRGWDRWHAENPKAHSLTEVSRPAYDPATRLLLIYIGTQRHGLDGAGFLKMYRLKDGKLTEVWGMGLWIS